MGRKSKQKSCSGCVEAKRRCDKRHPSCTRCLDRALVCTYPLLPSRQAFDLPTEATPDMDFNDMLTSSTFGTGLNSSALVDTSEPLFPSIFTTNPSCFSVPCPSSSVMVEPLGQLTQMFGDLGWFLRSQAWTIRYHYSAPEATPTTPVLSNFIRGLQSWLSCFVKTGHNPFIHRHLYSESGYPQCIQDAYSACVISNAANSENDSIINAISSTYISNLLNTQPVDGIISTRDHLARTQALLIHILLSLFSSSIQRRAKAESLISLLHGWNSQLWDSATSGSEFAPLASSTPSSSETASRGAEPVSTVYRSFILSESIRRTWLLCNLATGVYGSLKGEFVGSCGGDVPITMHAKFWEAPSSARWEFTARHTDPFFIYSLKGQTLLERGVSAIQVDEFARHLFTIMWGLEMVETWVMRTGDEVSVIY